MIQVNSFGLGMIIGWTNSPSMHSAPITTVSIIKWPFILTKVTRSVLATGQAFCVEPVKNVTVW